MELFLANQPHPLALRGGWLSLKHVAAREEREYTEKSLLGGRRKWMLGVGRCGDQPKESSALLYPQYASI